MQSFLLSMCVCSWKLGRRKWACRPEEHCYNPCCFLKIPVRLQNSKGLYDNVYFEWCLILLELTVFIPALPYWSSPGSYQLGIHLCSQTFFFSVLCILVFIDFCNLERCFSEGLEVTNSMRGYMKQESTISRIVIADSQVLIVGLSLWSC